ncbi:hypothetical protein GC173_12805 [bacterium]|nr:hypothetical protein [bacterium]
MSLQVSSDGGVTFPATAAGAAGVGLSIAPGVGKSIVWNPETQFPNQVLSNAVLRVTAEDSASSLTITNHGFEENPQSPGVVAITTPSGWAPYNAGNLNGSSNVIGWGNFNGTTHFDYTPEGSHLGVCFLSGSPEGEAGLQQTLSDLLELKALYTLRVEIGNIDEGTANFGYFDLRGFPGYRVDLLAGASVLASDANTLAGSIPDGEARTSTVAFATGPSHADAGAALSIRLVNLDSPPPGEELAREVNFDNVRLLVAGAGLSPSGVIDTTVTTVSDWPLAE